MRAPWLTILLVLGCSATAQHGPRIGLGLATQGPGAFRGSTRDMLPAPLFGWCVEAQLHPQVRFAPELLWVTKGAFVRNPAIGSSSILTLRYLEVPLLLRISTDRKADGMFLLAGAGLGWFLKGREQRFLNGQLIWDEPYQLPDLQRRSQFNVVVGMGMEGRRWGFDVRGQSSLGLFDRLVTQQSQVYAITFTYRMGNPPPEPPPPAEEEP